MARRRRGSSVGSTGGYRVSSVASDALRDLEELRRRRDRLVRDQSILAGEDRRRYHPAGPLRPAFSLPRYAARLRAKSSAVMGKRNDISSRVGFAVPDKVAICVRRNQRREVLHAIGKTGGGNRSPRWSDWSYVDC